jgi:hypothetical protein
MTTDKPHRSSEAMEIKSRGLLAAVALVNPGNQMDWSEIVAEREIPKTPTRTKKTPVAIPPV